MYTTVCRIILAALGLLCLLPSCPAQSEYCVPGVENCAPSRGMLISHRINTGSPSPGQYQYASVSRIKIKAPLVLKDGFKMIAGWKLSHFGSEFNSHEILGLGIQREVAIPSDLFDHEISLSALLQSRENSYYIFKLNAGWHGEQEVALEIGSKNMRYGADGIWVKKYNDWKEFGVGISVRNDRNSFSVIPLILYNKTFSERWGLEVLLPSQAKLRYNISPQDMILFGVENHSDNMVIGRHLGEDLLLKRIYSDVGFQYERMISGWVWAYARAGYQFNISNDFRNTSNELEEFNSFDKPFIELGVFLSPTL